MSNNNPYTLHTTLKPNHTYSCFGIKLKVKEQVDTFSNSGNFSIHINNINLKELESKGKGITKDTPIFCYVKDSKQTHITKLQDKTTSINIQIDKNLSKDSNGNLIPIIPKLVFLSFIPFRDTKEANNTSSQKIQLTADDINKGDYNVDFKIPLKCFGEWEENVNKTQSNNKDWLIELRQELHLIEAEIAFFAKDIFKNDYVRTKYIKNIKEMSNNITNQAKTEKDINKIKDLAQQANKFRNEAMEDMRKNSTALGKTIAETIKEKGQNI